MARKIRVDESREPGRYIALPTAVIDSPAYQNLSHTAKALLIEVARQRSGGDNGRLLLSRAYLAERGWHSKDVIHRAKRELLDAKLIHETVKGHRPNCASRYALTWYTLDKLPGYDEGTVDGFRRGMYAALQLPTPKPPREALFEKWRGHGVAGQKKSASQKILTPSHGAERAAIAPSHGVESDSPAPSHGAIKALLPSLSAPSHGHPLDKPFYAVDSGLLASGQQSAPTTDNDLADDGGEFERIHDRDLDPAMFDPTAGEFCPPPAASARQQRKAADRWVTSVLNKKAG